MAEIKTMDKAGIEFLIVEEGIVLRPYKDSKGIPTIGVGMTYYPETGKRVQLTDKPFTNREEAIRQFRIMLTSYEKGVWSVTRDDIAQHEFNALVSITYNIGVANFKASTLLKRVNNNPKDYARIGQAFEMWRFSDGKPILLKRRRREFNMYRGNAIV